MQSPPARHDEDRIDARRVAFDYGTIDRRRLLLYGSPYVSNGVLYNILHGQDSFDMSAKDLTSILE